MEKIRKVINTCNTCRTPIYEGETVYDIQISQKFGYNDSNYDNSQTTPSSEKKEINYYKDRTNSENWAQCSWCYDQWQDEIVRSRITSLSWK